MRDTNFQVFLGLTVTSVHEFFYGRVCGGKVMGKGNFEKTQNQVFAHSPDESSNCGSARSLTAGIATDALCESTLRRPQFRRRRAWRVRTRSVAIGGHAGLFADGAATQ